MNQGKDVRYAKPFFDLQLQFAEKVAELTGQPIAQVLLEYTNFYIRFGLGRDFDPEHPVWRGYLSGLQGADDRLDWTYRFYESRLDESAGPPVVATFGCFSYQLMPQDRIRLHFQNADGEPSLGFECRDRRKAELTALFGHVRQSLGASVTVVGVSWLYNLKAYRRLFPASYIATARVIDDRFRSMLLWGQFLDRHGGLKETMMRLFLERLAKQSGLARLNECFPMQILAVEAPVPVFYEFYRL